MWPDCRRLGVAAITYSPLKDVDLSKFPKGEPKRLWKRLQPSQKASLGRVAYEMSPGDVIYVKQGPKIVGRGTVKGPYQFDQQTRLIDPRGIPWPHHVAVDWDNDFEPIRILLGAEPVTVLPLVGARLEKLLASVNDADAPLEKVVKSDLDSLRAEERIFEEGGKKAGHINRFERDARLRVAAIKSHGTTYKACGFDFGKVYGRRGAGFIEVHHLQPVSSLKKKTKVDPKKDMTVLCSNCHRMIHRRKDNVLSVEELKRTIRVPWLEGSNFTLQTDR